MKLLAIALVVTCCCPAFSQNLTGSWYGKADALLTTGNHNNYLSELIIKQKGDEIEGIIGYYFRAGYKSQFIRGKYDKKSRRFTLKNLPVTYFRSESIDGVDCLMDLYATVMISKVNTTIRGSFITDPRYRYTCPELKVIYTLDPEEANQDSLIDNRVAVKYWQPLREDVVINDGKAAVDSIRNPLRKEELDELTGSLEKRKTIFSKELEVESDSLRVSFYDNGDIDGDTISVFLNKKPLLAHQALTASSLNIYLALDSTKTVNEITMYAENLGTIPPNTALMVVHDGRTRHEVYISSSLTQNAAVRIRKKLSK